MLIKRLAAIGAATLALAGVGVAAAGPASATVETGRWCQQDWSLHWTVCVVQQTEPDGIKWYHGHGWNDLNQDIIVDLFAGDGTWLWRARGTGWTATARTGAGWKACIYDEIHNWHFVCASRS
jgi:hypothetical protein